MFCPKCSQEIASSDLRFCPRCGLHLSGVAELLAFDGKVQKQEPLTAGLSILRRKDYRLGTQILFFSVFAVPIAFIFSVIFDSPGPLAVPLLIFLAGLAKLTYTFLFGKKQRMIDGDSAQYLPYSAPAALNEPRVYVSPVESFDRGMTNELTAPSSVTEKTTTLLKGEIPDRS